MEHQLAFADSEFNNKRRQTRKEKFLGRMEKLILDHTTIMNFRHLLERHGLARKIFGEVSTWLTKQAFWLKKAR